MMFIKSNDNYQLPEGYRQTEVGVIPEDWEVTCLDSVSKLSSGTTPSRAQEDRYYRNGEHHWVKTTDLNNSQIKTTEEKVTKAALNETCLQIYPPGTVLVAMYGGFNQIGRTGLIRVPAAVNQALVAIQAKPNKLDPAYLLANLNYRVEHWKSVASSSRKDPNITSQDVRNFVLPLPKPEEQRSIAKALSDVDALIAALDKAIGKKRHLKIATMQQLLIGKKRLPGFGEGKGDRQTEIGLIPEDWDAAKLGDIAEVIMGQSPKGSSYNREGNGLPLINGPTEFTDKHPIKVQWTTEPTKLCKSKDLLICVRGSSTGRMNVANDEFCIGRGVAAIRANTKANTEYLTYQVYLAIEGLLSFSAGSTFPSVDGKAIKSIPIPCPNPQEQRAIATVLSDMDAEIAALETRLAKTQALKQGMMQALLTGRVRLV